MEEQKRIEWIDVTRGLAIILVIILHSCTSAIRDNCFGVYLLYMFTVTLAVPVLSFLSGIAMAVHRDRYMSMRTFEFIMKKFYRLMIPYITYAVLVYLIFEILSHVSFLSTVMDNAGYGRMSSLLFLRGLLLGDNDYSIHLWFLYALFWNEILMFCALKYLKKNVFLIIILAICILYLRTFDISNPLPTGWSWGINTFVFYILGLLIGKRKLKNTTVITAAAIWMLFFLVFPINHIWNYDANHPSRVIIPYMGIIVIPVIGKSFKGKLAEMLKFLGQKSMSLYLFQQPFWGSALGTILYSSLRVPAYMAVFLCITASFSIPLFFSYIFGRYKCFKVLFGI